MLFPTTAAESVTFSSSVEERMVLSVGENEGEKEEEDGDEGRGL